MNRRHELSECDRAQIVGQIRLGLKQSDVAETFNITQSAVSKICSKFRNHGHVKNLPRPGRPRVTTRREDRHMVRQATANPKISGQ